MDAGGELNHHFLTRDSQWAYSMDQWNPKIAAMRQNKYYSRPDQNQIYFLSFLNCRSWQNYKLQSVLNSSPHVLITWKSSLLLLLAFRLHVRRGSDWDCTCGSECVITSLRYQLSSYQLCIVCDVTATHKVLLICISIQCLYTSGLHVIICRLPANILLNYIIYNIPSIIHNCTIFISAVIIRRKTGA